MALGRGRRGLDAGWAKGSRKEALSVPLLQRDGAIRVQGNWKEHSKLELGSMAQGPTLRALWWERC